MVTLAFNQWRREAINSEVQAVNCRAAAALFDFSFMSILRISGHDAASLISQYVNRDLSRMPLRSIRYCLHSDSVGNVLSDLTVWRVNDSTFDVMSGEIRDVRSLMKRSSSNTTAKDVTDRTAIFSVQGPMSLAAMMPACQDRILAELGYFSFGDLDIHGVPARVGRLGYTGERGFEIVVDTAHAKSLWTALSGHINVASFAVADILRIEAGFSLFCNEFEVGVTAKELSMDRFVDGPDSQALELKSLVCFSATAKEKPILWQRPQSGVSIPAPGELLATSACFSPLTESVLGLGYVARQEKHSALAFIDPLGQFEDIKLRQRPYFDPKKQTVLGGWDDNFEPIPRT